MACRILILVMLIAACRRDAAPACTRPADALASVWTEAIKTKVRIAFTATKKPYAGPAATAVIGALDGYFAEWAAAAGDGCKASLCLDQRLEEASALAGMLQDPTAALVEKADKAVADLDPVAGCASLPPAPPIESRYRADYRRLMLQTANAHAQAIGGQLVAAEGALMHAADEGKRIHADDLVALALQTRAAVLFGENRLDEAYQIASDAVWAALRAGRDDIVMGSALTVASARAGQRDVAEGWLAFATAAAARTGGFSPAFEVRRLELVGVIAAERGDLKTAIASHDRALAEAKRLWGDESPLLWGTEVQLATTLARSGAWVEAIPHFEHARVLREAAVGPDHPDVALILSDLAPCYEHAGASEKALAAVKRALQIRETTYGPTSPFLVAPLNNLADVELRHHQLAAALGDVERANAIATRFFGTASPQYHTVATTRAEILGASGSIAEARKAFDDVLALEEQTKSPELGTTLAARATVELAQERWADAVDLEQRSIAAFEASGGVEDLSLWKPLAGLARARRALDRHADVKPLLDRALAIAIKAQLAPDELDPLRAQLASL